MVWERKLQVTYSPIIFNGKLQLFEGFKSQNLKVITIIF